MTSLAVLRRIGSDVASARVIERATEHMAALTQSLDSICYVRDFREVLADNKDRRVGHHRQFFRRGQVVHRRAVYDDKICLLAETSQAFADPCAALVNSLRG